MKRARSLTSLAATLALASTSALAVDLSANIGFNSKYIYRGIPQKTSSAFGGLDLTSGGIYLGTWGADVGDGIEIDYYGGYGLDVGEFSFSLGGTYYDYTGDFDDTYREVNIGAGWKWFTLDAAIGDYANFDGPTLDYRFYSLTAERNGLYGKIGAFSKDFDGTYYEAGYGNTLSVRETDLFDYAIAFIHSDSTLLGGSSDNNVALTLSRTLGNL
ncbi:MAG: hypothetical protein GVY32_10855 [Gammaproteobacteria bacterium]|nr:hypothetical protein [Gammaproteobacteria bacterium]